MSAEAAKGGAAPTGGALRPLPPARELALVAIVTAAVWVAWLARTDFHVFPLEDVKQTVVAARELAAGHGMTSRVAVPPMLVFLAESGREQPPWPNALRAPLPVLLMGALMRVLSEPTAVALSSGIFLLLAAPLLYALGFRLAGRPAALLATAAYIVSPAGLYLGSTGFTESSTIAALAGLLLALMGPLSWRSVLVAGAAAAVGYLGRSTMTMWAVAIVAYILWLSRPAGLVRALGRAALFCLPLALAVWWWGAQMGALTGTFGYSAQNDIGIRRDTGLYPGRSSSLALEHWTVREFIATHPRVIVAKYARIAEQTWPSFITMGGLALLVAFFVAEFVLVAARARPASVHWLLYGLIALQLVMVPFVSFGHGGVSVNRYLDPFGPAAATLGAAFAIELLRRYGASLRRAAWPLAALLALMATPTAMDLAVGRYHGGAMAQAEELGSYLRAQGSPDDVVASSEESLVAWASGMYAIGLPITPAEFLRLHRELVAVDWVHIQHRGEGNRERTDAWERIMAGDEELPGFELVHRFSNGSVLLRRAG